MTTAEASGEPQFAPPGPGFWEQDAVHFPRPVTRYWTEMHPEPFARGYRRLRAFYGMLIDGLAMRVRQRLRLQDGAAGSRGGDPAALRSGRRRCSSASSGASSCSEWDETFKPAAIAKHRELQSVDPDALVRRRAGRVPRRAAATTTSTMIYQHMRFTARAVVPTGDFLAHVGDWTGLPAVRAARPDARRRARVGGRVRGARAADRRDRAPTRPRGSCSTSDGDPGRVLARAARARRRGGRGDVGVPRPRRLPAPRRLRHLRPLRARAARRAAAGDPHRRSRRGAGDVERRGADRRGPREGARGAPRAVRRAARRGAAASTGSATSAASSATSGRPGSCAAPCSRPGAGSRPRAGSTTPSTSSTPASTRCARWSTGSGGPSADELAQRADVPHLAHRQGRARRRSAPPPPPPPDPSGLPPGGRPASCARPASRSASCSAAPRRSTRRTSCAGSPPARASTRDRRGASPGPPSSTGSCRATCSSPSRRPRRSTSCCRCSARS